LLAFEDLAKPGAAGGGLLALLALDTVQTLLNQDLGHVADGTSSGSTTWIRGDLDRPLEDV
jgi:hypothetical protein